jgi:PhnB protein
MVRTPPAKQGSLVMKLAPYLFFDGRAEEAIEFYGRVLGAKVGMMMRFKENPAPGMNPPGSENKVMHASIHIGDSVLMLSDGNCTGKPEFRGFAVTLYVADDAEAESKFKALSDGGRVEMPLNKTFFASKFGMVADRFGVVWMVIVAS